MQDLYEIEKDQKAIHSLVKSKTKAQLADIMWSVMVHLKDNPKRPIHTTIELARAEWEGKKA